MKTLHIIEPTLNHASGHCYTVVHSLVEAANHSMPEVKIQVWAGRDFDESLMQDVSAGVHRHFYRRIRRLQLWLLLRGLGKTGEIVLLPTAGRSELAIFSLLSARIRQRSNIWFYLHQLRMDGSRAKRLAMLGQKIPDAHVLCTHPVLQQQMQQAGFQRVAVQPCPFEPPSQPFSASTFRQLIFPGEARMDKNLPLIGELVEAMHTQSKEIPVMIQAGPNHHGEFSDAISAVINKVESIGYGHLQMPKSSLHGDTYLNQFEGAICLQPYRVEDYAGKISGITLDALTRGCPCIAKRGTWPAEVVGEFGAGEVCDSDDVDEWLAAIEKVIGAYAQYQQGCRTAMEVLIQRHHPLRTLETISEEKA